MSILDVYDVLAYPASAYGNTQPGRLAAMGLLEKEIQRLERHGSRVASHDEMAAHERPILFSTLVAHAARHGLQHLGEPVLPPPNDPCYDPRHAAAAVDLAHGDPVAMEQILDFARMGSYRERLLCHAECRIDNDLSLEAIDRLRLTTRAESLADEGAMRVYALPGGIRMESQHRATILLIDI